MTRHALTVLFVLALSVPAQADVTIKASGTGEGLGMSGTMTSTTYIKGLKMRVDSVAGRKEGSTIFDVENQKMYVLDPKKKRANVWDMGSFSQEISQAVTVDGIRTSIKPNGQKKTIAGQNADGYDMEIVVPATVGGAGGMPMTLTLAGVTWVAKGAPGTEDYVAFYKGAAEKGWIFTDPRAAKGSPGQAKAMAQMYAELTKLGGMPYASEISTKGEGDGPMGALISKLGGMSMTNTTESVDTAPLGDDLFQPPADYELKQEK
jgi:hypothetical protein